MLTGSFPFQGDSTYAITKSGLLCEFNNRRLLDKWVELRTTRYILHNKTLQRECHSFLLIPLGHDGKRYVGNVANQFIHYSIVCKHV